MLQAPEVGSKVELCLAGVGHGNAGRYAWCALAASHVPGTALRFQQSTDDSDRVHVQCSGARPDGNADDLAMVRGEEVRCGETATDSSYCVTIGVTRHSSGMPGPLGQRWRRVT